MIPRRSLIAGGAALAAPLALPRFAIGQSDQRPAITIAVQKIANSNSLDDLREQSNVGTRMSVMYVERLIDLNYQGKLEQVPGLATAWRRVDGRTVELDLRRGVKFHNGDEMTADDVAFSFGPQRMFGTTRPTVQGVTLPLQSAAVTTARVKQLPAEVPPVARRLWPALDRVDALDRYTVRFVNATPDVTIRGPYLLPGQRHRLPPGVRRGR
jgi:peptide/nickel transport system substrate-binding protein